MPRNGTTTNSFQDRKKIEEDAEMFYDTEPICTADDPTKNDMSESQALMITINM